LPFGVWKMPKIIEVHQLTVSKILYNALRSFVASSLKEGYPWNTGFYEEFSTREKLGVLEPLEVNVFEKRVTFEKEGRWKLVISRKTYDCPWGPEAEERIVLESRDPTKATLVVEKGKLILINGEKRLEFPLSYAELKRTRLIADVPFAVSVSLYEVVEKIDVYVETFEEFCYNKALEEREAQAQQAQSPA
jgi:hypothetical protein